MTNGPTNKTYGLSLPTLTAFPADTGQLIDGDLCNVNGRVYMWLSGGTDHGGTQTFWQEQLNQSATSSAGIENLVTVGKSGAVDFNSVKDALDSITDATTNKPYTIMVYNGEYTEDPMTWKPYVDLVAANSHQNGVTLIPSDLTNDFIVSAGNHTFYGIAFLGPTTAGKCIIDNSAVSGPTGLRNCDFSRASIGVKTSGGATTVITGNTVFVNGPSQDIETVYQVRTGGVITGAQLFVTVPSAVLPLYSVNPIKYVFDISGSGSFAFVDAIALNVAPKDATQVGILLDDSASAVFTSADLQNQNIALQIGNTGTDTHAAILGGHLEGNTTNFKVDSSTGVIVGTIIEDSPKNTIVAGAKVDGLFSEVSTGESNLIGDTAYKFDTDKRVPFKEMLTELFSTGLVSGGAVTDGTGLNADIALGTGWIHEEITNNHAYFVSWAADTVSLTANAANYVGYDSVTEALVASTSPLNQATVIVLAIVETDGTGVRFIHKIDRTQKDFRHLLYEYLKDTRKFAWVSGLATSQGTTAVKLDVASGTYYRALTTITVAGSGGDATWSYFYGTDGATEVASVTSLNTTQYDNAGTLTAMTAGYFRTDTLYITSDNRLSLIYGTAEYSTQSAAEDAAAANPMSFIEESAASLAKVVVEQGVGIATIIDIRPAASAAIGGGGGGGGASDHGALSGLGDDDHTQYLLADGTRTMGGSLDMGANAITNVGNVDGVDISDHSARHQPGGLDALPTAAPERVGTANAEGTSTSFARADHVHAAGNASSAVASTGLLTGGVLSINGGDPALFDLTAGSGVIIDATTDPTTPVVTEVTWGSFSAQTITNLATNDFTYIYIDSVGAIVQSVVEPTQALRRDNILVGKIVHTDNVSILLMENQPEPVINSVNQFHDFNRAIGLMTISGNVVTPNGANLSLDKAVGSLHKAGIGYQIDKQTPNIKSSPADVLFTFRYRTQTSVEGSNVTVLDPTSYDNAGTVTAIGGSNDQATNQRVFLFPSGSIRIQYGQQIYSNLADALHGISEEAFVVEPNTDDNAVLLAVVTVTKGATDLTDQATSHISLASRFGEIQAGSPFPLIATDTIHGVSQLATQAEVDAGTDTAKNITPATLAGSTLAGNVTGSVTVHSDVSDAGSGAIITSGERTNLSNQSGTNTGDEVSATTTVEGIVELATQAEVDTGTDTSRVITPATLAGSSLAGDVTGSVTVHSDVSDAGSGAIITSGERTNLSNQSGTNTGDEVSATTTVEGIVELATQAEVDAGTDTSRVVTPSTLANYSGLGGSTLATKSGVIADTAFTGNPKKATVTFSAAFSDNNYAVSVVGIDARSWTIESKTSAGFTINANANQALTTSSQAVFWHAIATGETS